MSQERRNYRPIAIVVSWLLSLLLHFGFLWFLATAPPPPPLVLEQPEDPRPTIFLSTPPDKYIPKLTEQARRQSDANRLARKGKEEKFAQVAPPMPGKKSKPSGNASPAIPPPQKTEPPAPPTPQPTQAPEPSPTGAFLPQGDGTYTAQRKGVWKNRHEEAKPTAPPEKGASYAGPYSSARPRIEGDGPMQALNHLQDYLPPAKDGGNPWGDSASSFFFDTSGYDFGVYAAKVQNKVRDNWFPPRAAYVGLKGVVIFRFYIERDGRITELELVQSSGIPSFDESSRQALMGASPFPPLPEDFTETRVGVQFAFYYNTPVEE